MKNLFILSVLLLLLTDVQAQKLRLNDTSNVWITCNTNNNTSIARRIAKDTIVNGKQYFYHERLYSWIREDTIGPRYYSFDPLAPGLETLFVDMTLQVGDSISPWGGFKAHIWQVDSVLINGIYHRMIKASNWQIIEGVGPQYHVWGPGNYLHEQLCCMLNNGMQVAITPAPNNNLWVYSCALSVGDVHRKEPATGVMPNPATSDSRIVLPRIIEAGKLKIINTAGQFVVNTMLKHVREIPLREYHLAPGFYFFIAKDANTGESFQGKFTVQ